VSRGPCLPGPGSVGTAPPDMSDIYRKILLYRDIGPFLAYCWCIDIVGVEFERKNIVSFKISYFLAIFCQDIIAVVVKNLSFFADIQDIVAVVVSN
jgi:hypothetical protein